MIDRASKLKISIYPNQQGVDIDDPEEDLKKLSPIEIPLNQLRLNEPASKMKQPESRKQLKKFIDKIRRGMNINPIVVRKLDDKYQILDGHHRFFAHKALGIDKIKAVVVEPRFIEVLGEGRKKRKKINYYWPAFFGDGSAEAADGGGDGGGLEENLNKNLVQEFIKHVKSELELDKFPPIKLSDDSQKAIDLRSWGGYQPSDKTIYIVIAKRHPADVFRTLAHELVHYKQDLEGRLKPNSGMTGSEEENEANSRAAIIMRNFAQAKPNLFEHLNK